MLQKVCYCVNICLYAKSNVTRRPLAGMEAAQARAKRVADGIEQSRQALSILRPEVQVHALLGQGILRRLWRRERLSFPSPPSTYSAAILIQRLP